MTTTRTPGLRGRLPVKSPDDRYAIKYLHEYFDDTETPTYPVDVSGGITDWGMLGNDTKGDCGEAGFKHVRMSSAAFVGAPVPSFTTAEALGEYFEYLSEQQGVPVSEVQDTGVVLADFLMWLYKKGLIAAFAPVDHTKKARVDGAMQNYGGLYCGVDLTDDADPRFTEHKTWVAGKADPREGHCIEKVKATKRQDVWVTWGALQASTLGWTLNCLREAWKIITHEMAATLPADKLAALRADIDAAGGTGGGRAADPTPPPAAIVPVVVPTPAWKRVLVTLFVCVGSLPASIPLVAYMFNLSAQQSVEITTTVGGVVTAAAALHQFLISRKVLDAARRVTSVFRRKAA